MKRAAGLFAKRPMLVGLVLGVPLSASLLWLSFRNVEVDAVWSALTHADAGLVAIAVAVMGGVYAGQAIRWRAIARARHLTTGRFVEMVVSGVAVNNVLPGRIGDLLRARWLQVGGSIPAGRALATVVVDRGFDVFALVAFLALSLPLVADAGWLLRIAVGGLVVLAALALVLLGARFYTRSRSRDRRVHRSFLRRIVRDTLEGLADPLGRRRATALAGLSLVTWAVWALSAWLVARSLDIELSLLEAMFAAAVINLGVAIPSSPGFVGTYQWLGVAALGLLSVARVEALAFAILLHAVWYVPTTLCGGALIIRRSLGTVTDSRRWGVRMKRPQDA